MKTKTVRQIVRIDEDKCTGCGLCVPACVEGALQIVDGKARLISERYCDGLGACLGECPEGAITIEEREVEPFDEEAVKEFHEKQEASEPLPCGCASATVQQFDCCHVQEAGPEEDIEARSMLSHWPVQLTLVPPNAPFLKGADLVLAADCVPFAFAGFHRSFLKGHSLLVACPKLDDYQAHLRKLVEVLRQSGARSLTVVHMEVGCCFGLVQMAKTAIPMSRTEIPLKEVTIGVHGEVLS